MYVVGIWYQLNTKQVSGQTARDIFEEMIKQPELKISAKYVDCKWALWGLCMVSLLWENPVIFTDCGEIL